MKKRLKDKKIVIYEYKNVPLPGGFTQLKYKPIHPGKLWAYLRQQSAKEYYAAHALQITEDMLFVVNWRPDLITTANPKFYVAYKNTWYSVERIDTFEGYKEDIQIYGKLFSAPKPADILPYE